MRGPALHERLRAAAPSACRAFGGALFAACLASGAFGEEPPTRADLGPALDLVRAGQFEEAEKVLAALAESHPRDPVLFLLRGEVLNAARQPSQAVAVLRRAAALDPDRPRVHFELGAAHSALGETAAALEAFAKETELSKDPKVLVLCRLNRAILFQKDRKWLDAARELEQAIELEPERKEAYGDLAEAYLDSSRPEDAARTLERAAAVGFRSGRLQYRLGVGLFNVGDLERAAEAFRAALEISSELAQAELGLGQVLERLGRNEEARAHYERYLELRPEAPEAAELRKRLRPAKGR